MAALHVYLAAYLLSVLGCSGSQLSLRAYSEEFTQNAICRQSNCINPVFPGLSDLRKLDAIAWQCANHSMVASRVDFCGELVNYGPALPSPSATKPVHEIVKEQDDAAATMFFYHLSRLGYEAQEHRYPARSDSCVRAVWQMVCFTYFPKAQAGCTPGKPTQYLRPCRNACESYVSQCKVECCDESVQCTFQHTATSEATGALMTETGYPDAAGPAATCTGGALLQSAGGRPGAPWALLASIFAVHLLALSAGSEEEEEEQRPASRGSSRRPSSSFLPLAVALLLCAVFLQGCDMDVPRHDIGNWRRQSDYLVEYEFLRPGQAASAAVLNSCNENVAPSLQCSGRGYCKAWSETASLDQNSVSFCQCDRDWADPECRTRRKSQITTFVLSLFGGFLGLDLFYLGWPWWGAAKLATLGGGGFWWILDVVRTGSGPVYASDHRVANDLPHWIFVLSTVTLFGAAGFYYALDSYSTNRKQQRKDLMKLQESEESRRLNKLDEFEGPRYRGTGNGAFAQPVPSAGYGATLSAPLPNAGMAYAPGALQGSRAYGAPMRLA